MYGALDVMQLEDPYLQDSDQRCSTVSNSIVAQLERSDFYDWYLK